MHARNGAASRQIAYAKSRHSLTLESWLEWRRRKLDGRVMWFITSSPFALLARKSHSTEKTQQIDSATTYLLHQLTLSRCNLSRSPHCARCGFKTKVKFPSSEAFFSSVSVLVNTQSKCEAMNRLVEVREKHLNLFFLCQFETETNEETCRWTIFCAYRENLFWPKEQEKCKTFWALLTNC